MLEVNTITCGDCLELMKDIPDGSIDCVVTDPTWGIEGGSGTTGKKRSHKHHYSELFVDNEEYILKTCVPAIQECLRVSRIVIVTPGSKYLCHYPNPDSFGVFFQPATNSLQEWGRSDAQPIFYYGRDPRVGKKISSCSWVLTERPESNGHPCPKPIGAWKELIYRASVEGDTILDPFSGSGTTAVAALKTGRNFIAIEIDPKYCEIGQKRVDAELAQTRLDL